MAEIVARYSEHYFRTEYLPSYGIDPDNPNLDHLTARYDQELLPVERFIKKFGRILDVGAGLGLLLSQAAKRGWSVYGVELSEYGPHYAKEHFGIEIFHGILENASYPHGWFDAVMLQDTIEHVVDPKSVVDEIRRVLRPGGVLTVSTPNFASLGRRMIGTQWSLIGPTEHLVLFRCKTLRTLLTRCGFRIVTLGATSEVSPGLVHENGTPELERSKRRLEGLVKTIPKWVIKKLRLGDGIHCQAIKIS
jgi:SAM-dependent methyltransferase